MITGEPTKQTQRTFTNGSSSDKHNPVQTGILSNLHAGRSTARLPRLRAFLHAHPDVVHAETHHVEAVPEALAALAARDVELLLIYGGDGTLQHVLTALLGQRVFGDRLPMIAPLRAGSTNLNALDLGAHRNPIKGLTAVFQALGQNRLSERIEGRHVLRVTSKAGDVDQYGMFFGIGTLHRVSEMVHNSFSDGLAQGVFGPALVTGKLIARRVFRNESTGILAPDRVALLLDGKPVEEVDYTLLMTSTLHRLFVARYPMCPFWGTEAGPLRFTAIASRSERFGRAIPSLLRGKPTPHLTVEKGYTSHNIHQAELRLDCGFTLDGELYAPQKGRTLTITAADRLQFVRA